MPWAGVQGSVSTPQAPCPCSQLFPLPAAIPTRACGSEGAELGLDTALSALFWGNVKANGHLSEQRRGEAEGELL